MSIYKPYVHILCLCILNMCTHKTKFILYCTVYTAVVEIFTVLSMQPTDDPPQSPVSEQEHPLPISPNNSSQGDQLRLLLGTHSPVDNMKNKVEDRFQPSTDAQVHVSRFYTGETPPPSHPHLIKP